MEMLSQFKVGQYFTCSVLKYKAANLYSFNFTCVETIKSLLLPLNTVTLEPIGV